MGLGRKIICIYWYIRVLGIEVIPLSVISVSSCFSKVKALKTRKMDNSLTSEHKSNGVKKGGPRIIVDSDDEDLRCRHLLDIWGFHLKSQHFDDIYRCLMPLCHFLSVSTSPNDLSEMLAEGTKEAHDRAENCQFVKDFLRGRIIRELFKVGFQTMDTFWPCSEYTRHFN